MTNKELLQSLFDGNLNAINQIKNHKTKPIDYPMLKKYGITYGQITIFNENQDGAFNYETLKRQRTISESERATIIQSNEGVMFLTTFLTDTISDTLE